MVKIDHVIVLVLENRSFDHLLGYLDHSQAERFDGLGRGGPYANPGWANGPAVPASSTGKRVLPVDPDHSHDAVMEQLGLASGASGEPTNSGFVTSYERKGRGLAPATFGGLLGRLVAGLTAPRGSGKPGITARGPLAMRCQPPEHVPVLSTLAREFAVCQRWFCSVPGETWPNRNFLHAATSDGETNIDIRFYQDKTIFEQLEDHHQSWHIYHDDTPQVWAFNKLWDTPARHANWYPLAWFFEHVADGALEVGVRALVVAVVLLVRDDVVPRVLAVAQIGSAAEPRVVVGSVQRRPVVWLEERVARQRAVRDVLEEPGQRIPVGVPSRGGPQLVERPHLRGVVVVDVPALVMVLQLLEDGLVLVETDVDVRFAVRGGGVQEVAVRPGLPGHRAEPPLAHGELAGQGAQHRHVLGGLTAHRQRTPAGDAGLAGPARCGQPGDKPAEQAAEGCRRQPAALPFVAGHEAAVGGLARCPAGQPELFHHRVVRVVRVHRQHPLAGTAGQRGIW